MYSTAVKMMLDEVKKNNKIFDTASELKSELLHSKGTVVIIGPNSLMDPYELSQELSHAYPLTAVLLLLKKDEIDYKKAMFTGAVDVIDIDSEESEVLLSIEKAEKIVNFKAQINDHANKEEKKEAKVITVCSTKGGVGKTTISVNTAVALNKHNLKVAVIDLDLQFGDVTLLFDQQAGQTIYDWVKQSFENGDKSYESYITRHKMGIDILAAPSLPEFAELITGEHISYLIDAMKQDYDMIIIDTPPAFVETSLVALEMSDIILLIASMDLPALKNGKLAVETLSLLGLKDKIKVILNRDSQTEGITKEMVEDVLGMKIEGRIPSDYRTVISSLNKGEPFVTMAPRSSVAKSLMKISEHIVHSFPKEKQISIQDKKKKGFFSFKRSKK